MEGEGGKEERREKGRAGNRKRRKVQIEDHAPLRTEISQAWQPRPVILAASR